MIKVLVTGSNGMIGYHLLKKLIYQDMELHAIDKNDIVKTSDNYSYERFNSLIQLNHNIQFYQKDLTQSDSLQLINKINPDIIVHLAAYAGVSESFNNPQVVFNNNHLSFFNILEYARLFNPNVKILYASSSSVYGKSDFSQSEDNPCLLPTSSYALSKLHNEQLAKLYSDNYNISSIGLRFFTVYGEFNRKDMLMHYLLESFSHNKIVKLYNNGLMQRDFTYVRDVSNAILAFINDYTNINKHEIFNIGGHHSTTLINVVSIMESLFNKKGNIILDDYIPPYDPIRTSCKNSKLLNKFSHLQFTPIEIGIKRLYTWYKNDILS